MKIDRRLFRGNGPFARFLLLGVTLAVLAALCAVLQASQLARLLADAFHGKLASREALLPLALLLATALARGIAQWTAGMACARASRLVKSALRGRLFESHLHPVRLDDTRTGDFLALVNSGIEALDPYFRTYLPNLVLAVLVPLLFLAVVAFTDPLSGLVLAVTAPLIPIFMVLIGRAAERATQKQWKTLSRMGSHFLDLLRGLQTLKALNAARAQIPKVESSSEAFRRSTLDVLRVAFLSAFVLELVGTLATAFVAVQIGLRLLEARVSLELALFVLLLAPEFYLPLRQLGLAFHSGVAGFDAAARIFQTLDANAEARPCGRPTEGVAHTPSSPQDGPLLSARNLTYRHPGRSAGLFDVSFDVHAGERVGITGPSGAGKSTLLALLLRHVEPHEGTLRMHGIPSLPAEEWRRKIAWVPQAPRLLEASLADNIALGGASRARVEEAARQARIHDTIAALPRGYDSYPGEAGRFLSSGELQRVALARALATDREILVLDEPTSALDLEAERALQCVLAELGSEKTLIVVAHRKGLLEVCHRILHIEEGRIVSDGPAPGGDA